MILKEIFKFGCVMHTRNLRQRNLSLIWRWCRRGLRGDTWGRGENENNPKNRIPDERAHLGYLYIACIIPSRNYKVVQILSCLVRRRGLVEASVWPLRSRRKNFIAPRKRRRFPEHGGDGAVLVLAELDGVLYGRVVGLAAETIKHFHPGPDRGLLRRAFTRTNHFQRFEILAFFFQDDDYVGGSAGPQRQQQKLHRAGRLVRRTVGIDGHRVSGRARRDEFLFANPLHGSSLHEASRRKHSRRKNLKRGTQIAIGFRFVFWFKLRGPACTLNSAREGETKCKSQSQRPSAACRWARLGWRRFLGRQQSEPQRGRAVWPPTEKINRT